MNFIATGIARILKSIVCFTQTKWMSSVFIALLSVPTAMALGETIPTNPATLSPLHSIPPASLLEMRLHPAVFPQEAELSCTASSNCTLGLTRGFAIGGDALQTLGVTTLGQHFLGSGAWTFLDVNFGYQMIRNADRHASGNAAIGYRTFGFKNSEGGKFSRSGLTLKTSYAETMAPAYTQGLVFDIFSSNLETFGGADQPFIRNDSKNIRSLVREFALFMRSNPLIKLQFPADLEIANFRASDVDLPSPLRSFLRLNPIYEHSDIVIRDVEQTKYSWVEKRYALQMMILAAYASPSEKSGRLGLLGGLGFEMASSNSKIEAKVPTDGLQPEIPTASLVRGKLEIQATYQF